MRRALELARLGAGHTSPNPMVGAVIVHEDRIIGEGYHKQYGQAHAEVNAVNSVKNPELLKQSRLYVSLEPCNHQGRTAACTDLILKSGIPRVMIATADPNPTVTGKGSERLQAAGIEVSTGLLGQEALELNKRFFTFHSRHRPYVILKFAQTRDGFLGKDATRISRDEYAKHKQLSNELSMKLVHKWRSEEDAVLVGSHTVIHDDPQLNVRHWTGRDPLRLVLDPSGRVSPSAKVLDASQKNIYFTVNGTERNNSHTQTVMLRKSGSLAKQVLDHLYQNNILSLIVEGGLYTLQQFIKENLWDEARIFTTPKLYGEGISAPVVTGHIIHREQLADDELLLMQNRLS
jgi:diaminohydroxyphosphoribosylaminopyrimidine deaminase / 5-amino-6-(5-phosphoribosylamino)uracil reductase